MINFALTPLELYFAQRSIRPRIKPSIFPSRIGTNLAMAALWCALLPPELFHAAIQSYSNDPLAGEVYGRVAHSDCDFRRFSFSIAIRHLTWTVQDSHRGPQLQAADVPILHFRQPSQANWSATVSWRKPEKICTDATRRTWTCASTTRCLSRSYSTLVITLGIPFTAFGSWYWGQGPHTRLTKSFLAQHTSVLSTPSSSLLENSKAKWDNRV